MHTYASIPGTPPPPGPHRPRRLEAAASHRSACRHATTSLSLGVPMRGTTPARRPRSAQLHHGQPLITNSFANGCVTVHVDSLRLVNEATSPGRRVTFSPLRSE